MQKLLVWALVIIFWLSAILFFGKDALGLTIEVESAENVPAFKQHGVVEPELRSYLRSLTTPSEFGVLDAIARCESKYRNIPNYLYDGEGGRYTAFGPFQILKSTAARYSLKDRRDPGENVRIAVALYRARGSRPWNPSRQCWLLADSPP